MNAKSLRLFLAVAAALTAAAYNPQDTFKDMEVKRGGAVVRHWYAPTKAERPVLRPTAESGTRVGGCTVALGAADLAAGGACPAGAAESDFSAATFANPPQSCQPETWFHLIGGNVSKEGLSADIAALAEAGVGGIQLFTDSSARSNGGRARRSRCRASRPTGSRTCAMRPSNAAGTG